MSTSLVSSELWVTLMACISSVRTWAQYAQRHTSSCKCLGHSGLNFWGLRKCWLSSIELSPMKEMWLNVNAISWVISAKPEEVRIPHMSVSTFSHLSILYQKTKWRMSSCPSSPKDGLLHSDAQGHSVHHLFWAYMIILFYSPGFFDLSCWVMDMVVTSAALALCACSPHRLWPEWLACRKGAS